LILCSLVRYDYDTNTKDTSPVRNEKENTKTICDHSTIEVCYDVVQSSHCTSEAHIFNDDITALQLRENL